MAHKHEFIILGYEERTQSVVIMACKFCLKRKEEVMSTGGHYFRPADSIEVNVKNSIF